MANTLIKELLELDRQHPDADVLPFKRAATALSNDEYYKALETCADRYHEMVSDIISWNGSPDNWKLMNFILEFHMGIKNKLPLMKLNRWLGYIQGCLIERRETTVEVERDWTRPLFKRLDLEQ